jgi:hypothetical protein
MFVDQLRRNLKITTGTLSIFLGMQIEQRQDRIFVCQRVHTEKVLERFTMHDANPVATPCDRSSGGTEESVGSHVLRSEEVGCLMHRHLWFVPVPNDGNTFRHSICRVASSSSNGSTNWGGMDWCQVSLSIYGERATLVCCIELVIARECKCVQRCQLCRWRQNKTVSERRGSCVCNSAIVWSS